MPLLYHPLDNPMLQIIRVLEEESIFFPPAEQERERAKRSKERRERAIVRKAGAVSLLLLFPEGQTLGLMGLYSLIPDL